MNLPVGSFTQQHGSTEGLNTHDRKASISNTSHHAMTKKALPELSDGSGHLMSW